MGNQCADLDNRMKKKPHLDVVSRDLMLKQTSHLREHTPSSNFRKMGPVVKELKNIKSQWNER